MIQRFNNFILLFRTKYKSRNFSLIMPYNKANISYAVILLAFVMISSVSCKSKKVVIPSREEVDMIKLEYEDAGINMDSIDRKAKKKLEKKILKVENFRKKVKRKEDKLKEKGKRLSPRKMNKYYRKEKRLKRKVKKFHKRFIYSRQNSEVRRRMKKNMRKAKRRYRKRRK